MKVLVLAPNYPYPGYRFAGIFNEKSVYALSKLCNRVEVLAPRPYVPPLVSSLVPRWRAYSTAPRYQVQNGIPVYRPITPVIPRIAQSFWSGQTAFWWSRKVVREMHHRIHFDAIISFDLADSGGLAWRMARYLKIPASGWAFGDDIRVPADSSQGRSVIRALKTLDLVFYQSHELKEKAAQLLGMSAGQLPPDQHLVLPHGIPEPPHLDRTKLRRRIRVKWGIRAGQLVVLYIGRIVQEKGVLDLLEAISLATSQDANIKCVLIGSKPGFDHTHLVENRLDAICSLREKVIVLPECRPQTVWEYLCAADIFSFPSHNEGMPNSLLEAMAMGLPAIAFAIPAVQEIEAGTGAIMAVPPFDCVQFSEAILRLAHSPDDRSRIGEVGRIQVMHRFMLRKNMAEAVGRLQMVINKHSKAAVRRQSLVGAAPLHQL